MGQIHIMAGPVGKSLPKASITRVKVSEAKKGRKEAAVTCPFLSVSSQSTDLQGLGVGLVNSKNTGSFLSGALSRWL